LSLQNLLRKALENLLAFMRFKRKYPLSARARQFKNSEIIDGFFLVARATPSRPQLKSMSEFSSKLARC
jgi:hypothetical protein